MHFGPVVTIEAVLADVQVPALGDAAVESCGRLAKTDTIGLSKTPARLLTAGHIYVSVLLRKETDPLVAIHYHPVEDDIVVVILVHQYPSSIEDFLLRQRV